MINLIFLLNKAKFVYFMLFQFFASLLLVLSESTSQETLIHNLSFKKNSNGVLLTVYLKRDCHPKSINIMESSNGDEDSYTIHSNIEDCVEWENDKSRFTYEINQGELKTGQLYSVQITEKGDVYHSEPFVYDNGTCVFERNYKKKSNAIGIVALVISCSTLFILLVLVLIYKFCIQ